MRYAMVMMRIEHLGDMRHRLEALAGLDAAGALPEIGDALVSRVLESFEESRAPDGESWQPLARATKVGRLRRDRRNFRKGGGLSKRGRQAVRAGFQPLVDTGRLRASITRNVYGNAVEIGTDVAYAATHQFGDAGRGIPARPFLPEGALPPAWEQDVVEVVARNIREALK